MRQDAADLAQLGERKTEVLEVPSSILGVGIAKLLVSVPSLLGPKLGIDIILLLKSIERLKY